MADKKYSYRQSEKKLLKELENDYGVKVEKIQVNNKIMYTAYQTYFSGAGKYETQPLIHDGDNNPVLFDSILKIYGYAKDIAKGKIHNNCIDGSKITIDTEYCGYSFGSLVLNIYTLLALIVKNAPEAWKTKYDFAGRELRDPVSNELYFMVGISNVYCACVPIGYYNFFKCKEDPCDKHSVTHILFGDAADRNMVLELLQAIDVDYDCTKFKDKFFIHKDKDDLFDNLDTNYENDENNIVC